MAGLVLVRSKRTGVASPRRCWLCATGYLFSCSPTAARLRNLTIMLKSTIDPVMLAKALEAALIRIGKLGQPAIDAFSELMASRDENLGFDKGVDLLDRWISTAD